tara:strand:- start:985 stop:1158 length:174 start_codon:yes stop_codon:yes gene_type:complete
MKIYAYNLEEKIKFETTVEKILRTINDEGIFSEDEYFYVLKEDRDFHFNEMLEGMRR